MDTENKYDTDPLDAGLAREADEVFKAGRESRAATSDDVPLRERAPRPNEAVGTEEPTRRFDGKLPASYPSVFVPPPSYQPPANMPDGRTPFVNSGATLPPPSKRSVQRLGIAENIACGLAYAPFLIGLIVSLVELLMLPRSEARTRFHASQALGINFIILAVGFVFNGARFLAGLTLGGFATGMLSLISFIFSIAATIFLITSMVRAFKCQEVRHPAISGLTAWINQHLEPMK